MSSKKQKFEKQFKQNKVTTVTNKNKKYNKKMSKSDENYINGNYKKSVNQTVYGVKKNLAEGKTVHGYGSDYVDTKGMKRSRYLKKQNGENPYEAEYLYVGGKPKYVQGGTRADGSKYNGFYSNNRRLTKYEKESYKNTGTLNHKDYMPKESYELFGSANKNAKTFKEHLNTGSLDGIKTAKKNQRTGKHLDNAFEYVKGAAKDFFLDPVVDVIKGADYIGSTTVAGISGFAEDSGNVFKAIADPKRDLKYYSKGKSYTKENLKENFKSLNKTGSGQSMSKYLNDARKRGFEENYNLLKEQGRDEEAKEYKKRYEKETPNATKALNVTGFVGELLSPSTIENAITKVGKGLVKNTAKSFKDMVKGTADLSTAILPEETAKLMAKAQKYTGKANKSSDSVFYSGKKGATSIDKKLDNQYKKALDNVKDKINNNPNTKNLANYLNKISFKSDSLYAKEIDEVKDLASNITKNKPNTKIDSTSKYNLPSSNYNVDNTSKRVDPELKKHGYDKGNRYYEDYDKEFFKEVDHWQNILDKDPDNRLKNIERMKKYNKEVYDYMMQSVEESIGSFDAEKYLSDLRKNKEVITSQELPKATKPTYSKEKYIGKKYGKNHYWVDVEGSIGNNYEDSINNIKNINKAYDNFNKNVLEAKINKTPLNKLPKDIREGRKTLNSKVDKKSIKNITNYENMKTDIAVEKLLNIFDGKLPHKIQNNNARKHEFGRDINSLSGKILNNEFDSNNLNEIKKIINNSGVTKSQKIEFLNNALFGGKSVITRSATKGSINDFINAIDEINNVKKVIDNLYETGEILPITLSKSTREFLGIPKNKQIKITDKTFGGKNINNPEDIITSLTNTLINKSGSLTDARYWEKQQLLANKYGYEKVQYVKDEVDNIVKELKALDKQKMTPSVLARKQELSAKRVQLKELLENRQQDWDGILKSMNEVTFDNYIAKEYPEIMKKMDFYKTKGSEKVKIENLSNQNKINKDYNELLDELSSKQKDKDIISDIKYSKDANELEAKRNREYGSVRYKQSQLEEVGESLEPNRLTEDINKLKKKTNTIRKALNLPETKTMNVKLQKGQKLKDLPPVRENLAHLKKTIQKEIRYMFENPDKYPHFEDGFKQIKQGYVNTLRGYGVPDDKYFHKVTALQDELKSRMNKILEGGSENTPLLKMELQKLASKVDKTFDSFDNVVLDRVDDYVDDFERVIESENIKDSLNLRKQMEQNSNKPKKRAEISPITEQKLAEYEKRLNLPTPKPLLDFDIPGVDKDGVISKLDKNNKKPLYKDNEIYDGYKRWLNSYKKGLTVYNPGWHVQNFFQNKGQNYLALGLDAFKPQTDAKNILKRINGEDFKDKLIWNSKTNKAYTTDEIANLAKDFNVIDGLGDDVKNAKGIFSRLENSIDNTPLMKLLDKNEQTARLHHFVKQIEKGMSPEDAAKSVNKYLFDYSKKNKFDDFVGDFIDPFWTFHKNNAKLMYQSAIEHSDKIAKINRATRGLEEGIPENKKQKEENKYGKIQLPYSTIKDSVNKDDYNFLYSQNVLPNFEDAFPLDRDSFENKLNPIIRLFLQQSRGEGNFGNKIVDIKEGETPDWNEISKEDRKGEIIQELNPFMPNLFKTISSHENRKQKVEDGKQSEKTSDKQIFYDWVNYITGNKGNYYRNVDF